MRFTPHSLVFMSQRLDGEEISEVYYGRFGVTTTSDENKHELKIVSEVNN